MGERGKRRRNRAAGEWAEIVEGWRASGLSMRAYASAHDLGIGSLYGWAARCAAPQADGARARGGSGAFAEVRVVERGGVHERAGAGASSLEAQAAYIELVARSGRVLRVVGAVDAVHLGVVLEVAEGC